MHIKLPFGARFNGFCPQNDKSICFNILFYYFTTQYLTFVDVLDYKCVFSIKLCKEGESPR